MFPCDARCYLRRYPKLGRYAAQIFGYWKEGQYDIKWADPQGMAPTQVENSRVMSVWYQTIYVVYLFLLYYFSRALSHAYARHDIQ